MDVLLDLLTDWIKQGLIEGIMGRFSDMYETINSQIGGIATQVGQTPASWNV
jgi:hypothetical protein